MDGGWRGLEVREEKRKTKKEKEEEKLPLNESSFSFLTNIMARRANFKEFPSTLSNSCEPGRGVFLSTANTRNIPGMCVAEQKLRHS